MKTFEVRLDLTIRIKGKDFDDALDNWNNLVPYNESEYVQFINEDTIDYNEVE